MGLFINNGNPVTERQMIDYINTGTVYTTNFTGLKALTNSDIYTGVNIIAGDIAQSPFKPVETTTIDEQLLHLLNKEPKENQSLHHDVRSGFKSYFNRKCLCTHS